MLWWLDDKGLGLQRLELKLHFGPYCVHNIIIITYYRLTKPERGQEINNGIMGLV